jgi:HK97 family phage prohead protease
MTVDHAQALADSREAGRAAGRLHQASGVLPVPPASISDGSLLMRKCATQWHAGLAEGRDETARAAALPGLGELISRLDTAPAATERLHQYWVHGEGAAKIGWGQPGDFGRCVAELGKYIKGPEGYCNLAHHAALGIYPATHAAMEKKATGRSAVTVMERAETATASINDLPDSDFAYVEPGGSKDGSGKTAPRSLRHFPVHDAAHTRDALSRAPQSPFGDKAMPKIRAAAKKFGIDAGDDAPASASRTEFMRMYPLEDMHIIRSADGGDGRTVEAYAAVFDQEAEIQDFEGHYVEMIDPAAFNRAIDHASRARGGFPGSVKVLYNHGMTIQGTPSERFSVPIGVPVEIRAEARGLLTRTRYSDTPLAEEILESVRAGSISSQSFTGRIVRSTPQLRRGDRYRPRNGELTTVRRSELGLREYGPVLWPAYSGAEILGVRMSTPGELSPGPGEDEMYNPGTPSDVGLAAGDPLTRTDGDEHSARYHQHALYALRSKAEREKAGLVW